MFSKNPGAIMRGLKKKKKKSSDFLRSFFGLKNSKWNKRKLRHLDEGDTAHKYYAYSEKLKTKSNNDIYSVLTISNLNWKIHLFLAEGLNIVSPERFFDELFFSFWFVQTCVEFNRLRYVENLFTNMTFQVGNYFPLTRPPRFSLASRLLAMKVLKKAFCVCRIYRLRLQRKLGKLISRQKTNCYSIKR